MSDTRFCLKSHFSEKMSPIMGVEPGAFYTLGKLYTTRPSLALFVLILTQDLSSLCSSLQVSGIADPCRFTQLKRNLFKVLLFGMADKIPVVRAPSVLGSTALPEDPRSWFTDITSSRTLLCLRDRQARGIKPRNPPRELRCAKPRVSTAPTSLSICSSPYLSAPGLRLHFP